MRRAMRCAMRRAMQRTTCGPHKRGAQVSVIETVIRGDDFMRGYLSQEGRVFTGFVPIDAVRPPALKHTLKAPRRAADSLIHRC